MTSAPNACHALPLRPARPSRPSCGHHRTGRVGWARLGALFATAALLAACGGGGDAPPPPADPLATVPDNARATVTGLVGYLDTLGKNPSETRDPVDVSALSTLPTSDDGEPTPL